MIVTEKPKSQFNLVYGGSVLTHATKLGCQKILLPDGKVIALEKYQVTVHTCADKKTQTKEVYYMSAADLAAYKKARHALATK